VFYRTLGDENKINIFGQFGLGMIAAYRDGGYEDKSGIPVQRNTRGSVLTDMAIGVTIPLSKRWHIEPQLRMGFIPYPLENFKTFPHILEHR